MLRSLRDAHSGPVALRVQEFGVEAPPPSTSVVSAHALLAATGAARALHAFTASNILGTNPIDADFNADTSTDPDDLSDYIASYFSP